MNKLDWKVSGLMVLSHIMQSAQGLGNYSCSCMTMCGRFHLKQDKGQELAPPLPIALAPVQVSVPVSLKVNIP